MRDASNAGYYLTCLWSEMKHTAVMVAVINFQLISAKKEVIRGW
jgi:hypothetical protein